MSLPPNPFKTPTKYPPLSRTYEVPPKNPLSRSYRPPGGIAYKVQDGDDSFAELAKQSGLTASRLSSFNFLTTDPRELNWYLDFHVGCVKWTHDQKTWMLTSDANPGIIYFPNGHFPHSNYPLVKISDSHQVKPAIQKKKQVSWHVCWGAAVSIMLAWKNGTPGLWSEFEQFGMEYATKARDGKPIGADRLAVFLKKTGMTGRGKMPASHEWPQFLRTKGPVMAIEKAVPTEDHVVIVFGARFDNSKTDAIIAEVMYWDPGLNQSITIHTQDFVDAILGGVFPYQRLWHWNGEYFPYFPELD